MGANQKAAFAICAVLAEGGGTWATLPTGVGASVGAVWDRI